MFIRIFAEYSPMQRGEKGERGPKVFSLRKPLNMKTKQILL